jgi:hypothetical protein
MKYIKFLSTKFHSSFLHKEDWNSNVNFWTQTITTAVSMKKLKKFRAILWNHFIYGLIYMNQVNYTKRQQTWNMYTCVTSHTSILPHLFVLFASYLLLTPKRRWEYIYFIHSKTYISSAHFHCKQYLHPPCILSSQPKIIFCKWDVWLSLS